MSCAVNFCKNRRVRGGLRFYYFPKDPKRRVLWIKAARRWDLLTQPSNKSTQRSICSAHFVTGKFSTNPTHPDYVPSIFPFNKKSEYERVTRRVQRFVRHENRAKVAGDSFTPLYPPGNPPGRLHNQSSQSSEQSQPESQPESPKQQPVFPSGPLFIQLPIKISANGQPSSGGVQIRLPGYSNPVQLQLNEVDESRPTFLLIYNPSEDTREQVRADYEVNDAELAIYGDHTYCKIPPVQPVKTGNCQNSCQDTEPQEPSQHKDSGQSQEVTKNEEKRDTNEKETIVPLNETQEAEEAQTTVDSQNKETNAATEQNSGAQLKPMQCPVCGRYFWSLPHFASHIQKHVAERFKCKVCDKKSRSKSELERHMESHNTEKNFCCSFCGKCFQLKKTMQSHERVHRAGYDCTFCGKMFRNESSLQGHQLWHEWKMLRAKEQASGQGLQNETNPPKDALLLPKLNFHCSECDKSYSKQQMLDDHMTYHTGVRPHQCSVCEKWYGTKDQLKRHTKIHTREKRYKCSSCDRKFWVNAKLQLHIQAKHMEKTFECNSCPRKFATHAKMKTHSKIHTYDQQRPYQCPVCLHNFESFDTAEEHIVIHKKEREVKQSSGESVEHSEITVKYSGPQFLCTECGKTFYLKVSLHKHMQIVHTNE